MAHVDVKTGVTTVWRASDNLVIQEPCFVPRTPDAPEGDGWLLQAATDTDTLLTQLNIFEATNLAAGPIATIATPVHMKPAYHGDWVDGSRIVPTSRQ
jgi:carotenoid cleavage dioxygenase